MALVPLLFLSSFSIGRQVGRQAATEQQEV
jgi:hypothetical protein